MPIRSDGVTSISFTMHGGNQQLIDPRVEIEYNDGMTIYVYFRDQIILTRLAQRFQASQNILTLDQVVQRIIQPAIDENFDTRIVTHSPPTEVPNRVNPNAGSSIDLTSLSPGQLYYAIRTSTHGPDSLGRVVGINSNGYTVDLGGDGDNFTIRDFTPLHLTSLHDESADEFKRKYPDMECACCTNPIDQPQNMGQFLGTKELEAYIEYCKTAHQKPLLYCCKCFAVVEQSPQAMKQYKQIIEYSHELLNAMKQTLANSKEFNKDREEFLKDRDKMIQERKRYIENTQYLIEWMTELRRNPIKLILSQWRAFHYCKIHPKRAPKTVTEEQHRKMIHDNPLLGRGLTADQWLNAYYEPRWGRRYIYDPITAIYRLRYATFTIYGFHIKNKGVEPKAKLVYPIPYMKRDHGFGMRIH